MFRPKGQDRPSPLVPTPSSRKGFNARKFFFSSVLPLLSSRVWGWSLMLFPCCNGLVTRVVGPLPWLPILSSPLFFHQDDAFPSLRKTPPGKHLLIFPV